MATAARSVLRAVAFALAFGILLVIVSPRLADALLFLPSREDPGPPPTVAGVQGQDVRVETSDGVVLHAWWFEAGPAAPAVLLLHGNAGHIGHRIPLAEGLVARGLSVLLLDYRGYGRSEGRPTEPGLRADAAAGLDHLSRVVGSPRRVVLFGRSMGGTLAAMTAAEREVGALVMEATFTSLAEIGRAVYPFLPRIVFRRLRGRFDALGALERVEAPVLVIHGSRDSIVPLRMGRALFEGVRGTREWMEVPGADHNDVFAVGGSRYFDGIAAFVTGAMEDTSGGAP